MPPSSSDPPARSSAFDRLHPRVQRWIYEQRWTTLREVQEAAVEPILAASDVVIAAATAGGKTEAAFLPICSTIVAQPAAGIQVLYVSPLKALINDQYDRLERLGSHLDLAVHRWHGDVGTSAKREVLRDPRGILIMTPESLEALFVGRGPEVRRLFEGLVYVVVDELHAFIGTARGRQLQSLLHRVELAIRRRVPRVALSATLGDMTLAAEFLRPGAPERVTLISAPGEAEVRLQLRGYRVAPPREDASAAVERRSTEDAPADTGDEADTGLHAIAEHLFQALRGDDNLIFANSRTRVEAYADHLRRLSEQRRVPNEFWPHHGNLSRELREDVEAMLKDRTRPVSVVCTTTLEMGIDIGDMKAIAQVGAPPSVASLRQRLGRSGRRGGPAVLRIYVEEQELTEESSLQDALHAELVQTIAMVQLLLASWYEPPPAGALHLSTLVQQTLSLIAQHGGVRVDQAWRTLCQSGPFSGVDVPTFTALLRCLGQRDLIQQAASGELLLGVRGEQLVGHYSFYTAFTTPEEYQLFAGGRPLGSLPISFPLDEGSYLIFAGRRWRVLSVDEERRVIDLAPAAGGRVPRFSGGGGLVHDRVRRQMFNVYVSSDVPVFLDATARDLLAEGRATFARNNLAERALVDRGRKALLLCWCGDRILDTIQVILQQCRVTVERDGLALTAQGIGSEDLLATIRDVVSAGIPDARALAATVKNRRSEKYDALMTDELMALEYASRHLDARGAWETLRAIVDRAAEVRPSLSYRGVMLRPDAMVRTDSDAPAVTDPSQPPIRILWSLRDWTDALAALPAKTPLPCRTALVPRERVAHALRRRLLRDDRAAVLSGTRFITAVGAAVEVLRSADVEFTPGEESLRRARLLALFRAGMRLEHFLPELLVSRPGWDDAFAGAINDLESAGLRPTDVQVVASPAAGGGTAQAGADRVAAQLRDVTTIWSALDDAAGCSWTTARIYLEAARVLEANPARWPFPGAVLATGSASTTAAEARFLRSIPAVTVGILAARPAREHYVARLQTLFGAGTSGAASAVPTREHRTERDLLATYLFAPPELLADPGRPRSGGPDGSVDLEEHSGVEAELEATADWVARQIQEGTPLEDIAVLMPALDPLAGLVADRLARLPWREGTMPVHVAGGVPLAGTAAGARALAVVRALRAHLAGHALAEVLPALRSATDARHLSRGAAMRLAWSLGTAGGNPARPEGALEWSVRVLRREQALRQEVGAATTADGADDGQRVRARDVERAVNDLTAIRPALDALVEVARLVVTGASLSAIWPALRAFLDTWLLQPGAGPRVHTLLDERLAGVASDRQCGTLPGDDALAFIEQAAQATRLPAGRFGEPAIYLGAVHDAVGLEFRAVRVIGLAEGHLPAPPREDPVLPDALRLSVGANGDRATVTTTKDRSLAALHALDRVVRDTDSRIVLSAPRMDLDRSQREPSSVILEAAAALGRTPATATAPPAFIPDLQALRRDAFTPARRAALVARRARPVGAAAWLDAIAARALAAPPSWHGTPALDLGRIRSLLEAPEVSGLDGMLGAIAADLPVPGLTPERPISSSLLPTLLQCPHLFLLGTVLHLEEPECAPPLREIGPSNYGGLLHRVAERFAREHGAAFSARTETLPIWLGHLDRVVEQEFARFLDEYPLVGGAVSGRERERLRRDAHELLGHDWSRPTPLRFIDAERAFGRPEAVALATGTRTLYVRGRLDRIDVEGDLTLVRDFKTGRPHRRVRDEAEPVPALDVQLAVYGLVARQLAREWGTPARVGVAYTYVNRGVEERAFRSDFSTTLEPAAREWLAIAADLLARRAFPRTPNAADCTYCCFQPVCGDAAYDRTARLLTADPTLAGFQRLKTDDDEEG